MADRWLLSDPLFGAPSTDRSEHAPEGGVAAVERCDYAVRDVGGGRGLGPDPGHAGIRCDQHEAAR